MGKLEEINGQSPNSQMLSLANVLCYVVVWRLLGKIIEWAGLYFIFSSVIKFFKHFIRFIYHAL